MSAVQFPAGFLAWRAIRRRLCHRCLCYPGYAPPDTAPTATCRASSAVVTACRALLLPVSGPSAFESWRPTDAEAVALARSCADSPRAGDVWRSPTRGTTLRVVGITRDDKGKTHLAAAIGERAVTMPVADWRSRAGRALLIEFDGVVSPYAARVAA